MFVRGPGVFALIGAATVACSVFPESAPAARGPDGGSSTGGAASGGSTAFDGGSGGAGAFEAGSGGTDGSSTGGADGGSTGGAGGTSSGGTGGAVPSSGGREAGLDAAPDAPPSTGGSTSDAGPVQVTAVVASIADCVEEGLTSLSPDACRTFASTTDGPNEVWVNVKNPPRQTINGYLRFDVPISLAVRTIVTAKVELTTTTYLNAPGPAPDVWNVTSFTRASLFSALPVKLGASPVAAGGTALPASTTTTYTIPSALVIPGAPTCLGLYATIKDSVGFWNADGTIPPRLVIEYR